MFEEYVIECPPLEYPYYLKELQKAFEKNEYIKQVQHDGNFHYVTTAFYFDEAD